MTPVAEAVTEQGVLRARATGELACDLAFEQLHSLYASVLLAWLELRVPPTVAEDLAQDVWVIFHARWRKWQFLPEMEMPEARPVLSFLYRTCKFVLLAHWRQQTSRNKEQPLETANIVAGNSDTTESILRNLELGRVLKLATEICTTEEMDVLAGKLAGVPIRELARATGSTEAVVDHRFRDALSKLRKRLAAKGRRRRPNA